MVYRPQTRNGPTARTYEDLEAVRGTVMATLLGMSFWLTSFLVAGWLWR